MSFTFNFTEAHLREILKGNREVSEWYQAMVVILPKWDITTPNRVAAFLAQTAHESLNFTVLEENLNYSWKGLRKTFSRYFPTDDLAKQFERKPEQIANRVYADANRSKSGALGNTQTGDGWRFRGRGIIQLTGRNNYTAFAKAIGKSLDETVEYLKTKPGALESAAWFWSRRNINVPADAGRIDEVSRLVNGGTIGLTERRNHYSQALRVLNGSPASVPPAPSPAAPATLRLGSRGDEVRKLQTALGITADGVFGPGTERALKQWQAGAGLIADGIAGPATFRKLYK
jgi:putative chitinase